MTLRSKRTSSTTVHGSAAILIPHREQNGGARLAVRPVPLEEIVANGGPAGGLELEQVLDDLGRTLPARLFREVIPLDEDVCGDPVGRCAIGSAEQDVLTRRLQVIVADSIRSRSIPCREGLRVLTSPPAVRDVRAGQGDLPAITRDCPLLSLHAGDDQQPIHGDVARVLQDDDRSLAAGVRLELQAVQAPVRQHPQRASLPPRLPTQSTAAAPRRPA